MTDDDLNTDESGFPYAEPDRSNKEAAMVSLLFVGVVGMSMALVGLDLNVTPPAASEAEKGEEGEVIDPEGTVTPEAIATAAAILPGALVTEASEALIRELLYEDEAAELPPEPEKLAAPEPTGSAPTDPYDDLVMVGDAETPVRNAQGEQVKLDTPKTRVTTTPRSALPAAPTDSESKERAANPAPAGEEPATPASAAAPTAPEPASRQASSGGDIKGQMNAAKKLLRSGDPVGAAREYKKALSMGGGAGARLGLAKANYEMGKTKQAQRELKKVLASNPRSGGALLLMGSIAQGQGDRASARSYYQKFLDAHPNSKRAERIRGILTRL